MKFSDIDILKFGHEIQITGMVLTHGAINYICHFPDEKKSDFPVEPYLAMPMTTEEFERMLYQSDVLDVELIGPKKAIVRKSQRQIDQSVSWAVFKRDGYRCRYCGRDDVPLTVDHIVTWESGGVSIQDNLLAVDKRCNRTRGPRPYKEWLESADYLRLSVGIRREVKIANEEMLAWIPRLEALRVDHQRSR